jgi:heptosyltransferase-1
MLARLTGVDIYGFNKDSARESLAARFYKKTACVAQCLHVIDKNRQLVAQLFDADISHPLDYGLEAFSQKQMALGLPPILQNFTNQPTLVLLHGTTWNSKYWPESSWLALVGLLAEQGVRCLLPWGNEQEQQRALRLQPAGGQMAVVLPKLPLTELMRVMLHTQGFVSVETGIGHLATVLDIPGIMLHGPTDPAYSGILDKSCVHITCGLDCSPCFKRDCPKLQSPSEIPPCQSVITAQKVVSFCKNLISKKNTIDNVKI